MIRIVPASSRALLAALLLLASLTVAPLRGQASETPTTFDHAGLLPVITHSHADRLGLRPPGWRVQGEYRDVRVFKGDGDAFVLVIQKADGTMERMPLGAEQFESLRLEVETRISVLAGGGGVAAPAVAAPVVAAPVVAAPVVAAPVGTTAAVAAPAVSTPATSTVSSASAATVPSTPRIATERPTYAYRPEEPSKSAGGDFARNQLALGVALYGPLTAALVEESPGAFAAYIATVAATYFAVVKPAREGAFTQAQNRLATGMAVGGAMSGAALAYTLGLGASDKPIVKDKGMLGFALAGAFAGAFAGTVLGKPMSDGQAEGINLGAGTGLLFASGLLATTKGESWKGDARLIGAVSLVGLGTGAWMGYRYVSGVDYTVTSGDLTGLASPALVGMLAGLTIARPTATSSVTTAAGLTTAGLAAGLIAGDWFFVRRWDMTPQQGWLLNGGTLVGAAVMTAPFFLGNQRDAGVLFGAATVGGLLGAWGVTQLSSFAPGTMRARPARRGGRVETAASGAMTFDVANALMAAGGMPGYHALLSIRF